MLNPPNSDPSFDLLKRITQRLQQEKVDTQLFEIFQQVFDKELDQANILLSRPEKKRLFHQSAKEILADMLLKLDRDN